jgi:hypothetical protein
MKRLVIWLSPLALIAANGHGPDTGRPSLGVRFVGIVLMQSAEPDASVPNTDQIVGSPPNSSGSPEPGKESVVQAVLREQSYPWYDGETDRVKPILSTEYSRLKSLRERLERVLQWLDGLLGRLPRVRLRRAEGSGEVIPTLLFLVSGALLAVVLWRLWRLHEPREKQRDLRGGRLGGAARIAGLSSGVTREGEDPWNEAVRRRADGDRSGAVIWLFAYQLLALEQQGLIRLAPGRTARQYVLALDDSLLRDGLRTTLGLFEEVYYGHRVPTLPAFESVWARAEAFRDRLASLRVSP